MSRVFTFELPFEYTFYITQGQLFFWVSVLSVVSLIVIVLSIKSFFAKVQGGYDGIIGQNVVALADFSEKGGRYEGQVLCLGERWIAVTDFPVKKDERLMVSHSEGLTLFLNSDKRQ